MHYTGIYDHDKFIEATENGNLELVKQYVEEVGLNVHVGNDQAFTLSIKNNHLEVVRYLLEKKEYSSGNLLDYPVGNNNYEMTKLLLEFDIGIYCYIFLYKALNTRCYRIVDLLINKGFGTLRDDLEYEQKLNEHYLRKIKVDFIIDFINKQELELHQSQISDINLLGIVFSFL